MLRGVELILAVTLVLATAVFLSSGAVASSTSLDGLNVTLSLENEGGVYRSSQVEGMKVGSDSSYGLVFERTGGPAGYLEIGRGEQLDLSNMSFNSSRPDAKSFIHLEESHERILEKTLIVPRERDTGEVLICPGADTLDDVSRGCSDGYVIESGERRKGVTNEEISLNGSKYYKVTGISGTGGQELIDWDSEPGSAEVVTKTSFDEFENSGTMPLDLDGGNVTSVDLSSRQATDQWAGIYGNFSGTLVLGVTHQRLYSWEADLQYVFASNSTVRWEKLSSTTPGYIDEYFGMDGSDKAESTFTRSINLTVENHTIEDVPALRSMNSSGSKVWLTAALKDGENPVFVGLSRKNGTAFNGDVADYQMMVPARDKDLSTYFIFAELT